MKTIRTNRNQNGLWLLWALTLVLFTQCDNRKPGEGRPARPSNSPSSAEFFYINDAQDQNIGSVQYGDPVMVSTEAYRLQGRLKGEKRKYHDTNDDVQYEVKYSDKGFKLKKGEQLICKVKWNYDSKIKFADNEEMEEVEEIKISGSNYKWERGDEELAKVSIEQVNTGGVILDQYKMSGINSSLAGAVILIEDLSVTEKLILMAELKKAGK